MAITFELKGDLSKLLRGKWIANKSITISMERRASVKDVLESIGLPHTEVGALTLEDRQIDFSWIVKDGECFTVDPVQIPFEVTKPSLLRPLPLTEIRFVADVNVGRLARYLRAAGFDTLYDQQWRDEFIADLLNRERRILLTRDLRLLMRKHIDFGRYVRAIKPEEQLKEIISLFGLEKNIEPFTRCLDCNALLTRIAKEDVLHRLEPLTKKYYTKFSICTQCDKIYWSGSHVERMKELFF